MTTPMPDLDAVCTACRWRFSHAPDCPRKDEPWPTIQPMTVGRCYVCGAPASDYIDDENSPLPVCPQHPAPPPQPQGACVQVEGLRRAVDLAKDRQLAWQKAWGDDRAATDLHNALPGLWAAIDATLDRLVQVEAERAAWKAEHYRMLELAQSRAAERDAARKALEEARYALGKSLDDDFALWSSPTCAAIRSPVYALWKALGQALSDLKDSGG